MLSFFKNNESYKLMLETVYVFFPLFVFISYAVLIIFTLAVQHEHFFKILLVPAGVFLLVTLLRKFINAERPYEKFKTSPLFGKKTKGKSMPSRHTASAFIIAMAFLYYNLGLGLFYIIIALMIAASRVLAGVHYPRDTAVGMIISIACGIIFLFLI